MIHLRHLKEPTWYFLAMNNEIDIQGVLLNIIKTKITITTRNIYIFTLIDMLDSSVIFYHSSTTASYPSPQTFDNVDACAME